MKKVKYIFGILASVLAIASCQNNEAYVPNETPEGAQVYFPSTTVAAYTADASMTKIDLTLVRVADEAEGDYGVEIVDTTKNHIFFPADHVEVVEFAAGQKEAQITIPVDYSKLQAGLKYALALNVLEDATPYGANTLKVVITVPEPWHLLGTAIISDNLIAGYYNYDPIQFEAECYTNDLYPGSYFFKNAYTSRYPKNDVEDYVAGDVYFEIAQVSEGKFYVPYQSLGMAWSDGEFKVVSYIPEYFNGAPENNYGYMDKGIIKFDIPKSILVSEANYNDGGFSYTNASGKFFIALPGAVLKDFTTSISYGGMVVAPDNSTVSMVVNFSGAEDVASVAYAMSATASADDILASILGGEYETATLVKGAATVLCAVEPGLYTVVAVPVDSEGELQPADAVSKKISFPGLGSQEAAAPQLGVYSFEGSAGTLNFTLAVNPDDPTDYYVGTPAGLPDGSQWHATYDAVSNTLTCSGLEVGYEQYENQFGVGVGYGWFNKANLYMYGYASFTADMSSEDGTQPIVYNLDAQGFITGIQGLRFGAVVYQADASGNLTSVLGWSGYYLTSETAITYVGEAVSSVGNYVVMPSVEKSSLSKKTINVAKAKRSADIVAAPVKF